MTRSRVADARAALDFAQFLATFVEQTSRARDEVARSVAELERRCDDARVTLADRAGSLETERTAREHDLRRCEPGSPEQARIADEIVRLDRALDHVRRLEDARRSAEDGFFRAVGEYRSAAASAAGACVEAERDGPHLATQMRMIIAEYTPNGA